MHLAAPCASRTGCPVFTLPTKHSSTAPRPERLRASITLASAAPEIETAVLATGATARTHGAGACHPPASVTCSPAQRSGQSTGRRVGRHPGEGLMLPLRGGVREVEEWFVQAFSRINSTLTLILTLALSRPCSPSPSPSPRLHPRPRPTYVTLALTLSQNRLTLQAQECPPRWSLAATLSVYVRPRAVPSSSPTSPNPQA